MATGVASSTPQTVPDTPKAPEAPKGEQGDLHTKPERLSLIAVHGDIYHPFDNTKFTTDAAKKHDRDDWVNVQLEAGKLKVEE